MKGGLTHAMSDAIPREIDIVACAFILNIQEKPFSHAGTCRMVSSRIAEAMYSCETSHASLVGIDLPFQVLRLCSWAPEAASCLGFWRIGFDGSITAGDQDRMDL